MDEIKRYELKCKALGIKPLELREGVNGIAVVYGNYMSINECTVPKFVSIIEKAAFVNAFDLERVDIKSGVKILGEFAFKGCMELRDINLENVESIENEAFCNCKELRHIKLSNIKTIGEQAFKKCVKLENIEFNRNVDVIRDYTFSDCCKLDMDKNILKNAREIGLGAFKNCSNIKGTLEIDKALRLGSDSFAYSGIEELVLNSDIISIESKAFMSCEELKKVSINGNTEYIDKYAFAFCSNLKELELGDKLKEISTEAFKYCGMDIVYVPKSVEIIRIGAFSDCTNLKRVILSSDTEIEEFAFEEGVEIVRY